MRTRDKRALAVVGIALVTWVSSSSFAGGALPSLDHPVPAHAIGLPVGGSTPGSTSGQQLGPVRPISIAPGSRHSTSSSTGATTTPSTTATTTPTTVDPTTADTTGTTPSSTSSTPTASSSNPAVATTSASPVIGISIPDLVSQTPATQAAWLANLKSIGITSVRIDANWGWVMYAGANTYDWSQLDQEVSSIRAAGMTADLIIDGCPSWAAVPSAVGQVFAQPAETSQFAAWAAAVAARYAPEGVTDYEIWNEPNNSVFWKPAPDPAAYTADLQAAYAAIKTVDPSAFVISGGLAPVGDDGGDIDEVTFLQDMYADGAKGFFDALGDHPYSYPALPDTYEIWSGWSAMDQTPTSLEGVLAANGDASKPIWATEVGAPTSGPDGVGTAAQATELTQAIDDAKTTSWIGALYIYTYEDSGSDPSTDEDWFGLLNADGSPKPAFAAVAAAIG